MKDKFTKHLDEGEVPIVTTDYKQSLANIRILNNLKLVFTMKKAHGGFVEIIAELDRTRIGNMWYRELDSNKKFDEPTGIFLNDQVFETVVKVFRK